jgi:hypothetical protein
MRFPVVTMIMIIITFFFIVMYMVTSNLFFYGDNPLKDRFEKMGNDTIKNPLFKNTFLNNSANQKTFFQYGMVTSVCMCPVIGVLELLIDKKRSNSNE